MVTAKLTSKGQITIPKQIRESLHLHNGDKVQFLLQESGEAILRPITRTVDEVYGKLKKPKAQPHSVGEMNAAIRKRMRAPRG